MNQSLAWSAGTGLTPQSIINYNTSNIVQIYNLQKWNIFQSFLNLIPPNIIEIINAVVQIPGIFPPPAIVPIFKPGGGGLGGLPLGGLDNLFPGSGGDNNAIPPVIGTPVQNPLDSNSASLLIGGTGILTTYLTVLGNITVKNNIYSSNVLATNMYSSNTYTYNSFANNSYANRGTFDNLIFCNALGDNLQVNNLFCQKGTFNNLISNNALIQNLQANNAQISFGTINDLTITNSIKFDNQLDKQIFNEIRKSSTDSTIVNTVDWGISNIINPDSQISIKITESIKNTEYSGTRIQSFTINTYTNVITSSIIQGYDDIAAIQSMSISFSSTGHQAIFTCTSILPDILNHSLILKIVLISDNNSISLS